MQWEEQKRHLEREMFWCLLNSTCPPPETATTHNHNHNHIHTHHFAVHGDDFLLVQARGVCGGCTCVREHGELILVPARHTELASQTVGTVTLCALHLRRRN